MPEVVYALCAITSALCAVLLARAFARRRVRLLLWAAICFAFLGVQNVLLFLDLVILTEVDLSVWRAAAGMLGIAALLFGMISDGE